MKQKGYTLIELLVAISIFTIVLAAPTGFFVSALKGQQKALASQEIIDNISYNLEYISRALRMAQKDKTQDGDCIEFGYNYKNPSGLSSIRFLNYNDVCQEFFLLEKKLYERKSSDGTAINFGDALALTPANLEINSLKFELSGEGQGPYGDPDYKQPRVTIFLEAKIGNRPESQAIIKIQTTISQRNLDVQY